MNRTERDEKIVAMAAEGLTLDVIAAEVGLTRERVRQILIENGTHTFRHPDRIAQAIEEWKAEGRVRHAADVLRERGIAPNTRNVAALNRAVPHLALPQPRAKRARWTEEDIVAAVRDVALRNGIDPAKQWMPLKVYARLRGPHDPATATIGANYLWSDILIQAGFDPSKASKRGRPLGNRTKHLSDEQIDQAVLDFMQNTDRLTSEAMYEFLLDHPVHPSMATVRNRFRARGIDSIPAIFADVQARLG